MNGHANQHSDWLQRDIYSYTNFPKIPAPVAIRNKKKKAFEIQTRGLTASVGLSLLWQTLHHEAWPENDLGTILTFMSGPRPNPKFPSFHFGINSNPHGLSCDMKSR